MVRQGAGTGVPIRATVIADHEIPGRPAITVAPGDVVTVGDRDTQWPAFVFVETRTGSGWVPERHLDDGRPLATVVRSYDTQELPVSAGAEVTLEDDDPESGWAWCVDADGRAGWVPHQVLRLPAEAP